jgi:cell division protein FtsL
MIHSITNRHTAIASVRMTITNVDRTLKTTLVYVLIILSSLLLSLSHGIQLLNRTRLDFLSKFDIVKQSECNPFRHR